MNNRKLIVGALLTAVGLAPAFISATPAAAQDQTKEKQHKADKGQRMTLDQVPQPVQQTINQEAQGGTVGKIKQETSRGKAFYEAEVTDQSGKKHHVRVNEDGSLMKGRSARATKESSSSTTQSTTK